MMRPGRQSHDDAHRRHATAGQRLLKAYATLATRGEHLLHPLLQGNPPVQWRHYPEDDAIDAVSGYQWFYHSHSPEDRLGLAEHGHFHLFARRPLWSRRLQSRAEKAFADLTGHPPSSVATRHLLAIGVDAKGLPISLFTVNSWVTGDLMLSASTTERLLSDMQPDTGHPHIDTVLGCVLALCAEEIGQVLATRDRVLASRSPREVLDDRTLEVLSESAIVLDEKLSR